MTLALPEGYGNATMKWTYLPLGRAISCTMGFHDQTGSDAPVTAASAIRSSLITAGGPCVAANMYNSWRFEGVTVLMRNSFGNLVAGANLTPVTGTVAAVAGPQPVYTPMVITKNTQFAGRAFRGRMYVPSLLFAEGNVSEGGALDTAVVTFNQTAWNAYLTAQIGTNYPPVLLHHIPDVGVPIGPSAVISLTARSVVGIQRRRRNRGA